MDFSLSEEQQAIVATVRRFVEAELMPHEEEVERFGEVPTSLAQHIRSRAIAAGLYAANMPEELGGGGLDAVAITLVEREFGATSFALQSLVARPSNVLQGCVGRQVEEYLLPTVRGEKVDCLAMTEPEAGSDVRAMRTRATTQGSDWVITGTKHFISHADVSDFVILFAATGQEETSKGPKALISAFLVDLDSPGLTVRTQRDCVSNRGYHQSELVFDGCRVPGWKLLGEEGRGFELMNTWLGATRLAVAATCVGKGRRALRIATEWAATRQQFGRPIGQFQGISFALADMACELDAAELLTLRAASHIDAGAPNDSEIAMAKLFASETAGRVTDKAVQILGGMGLMGEMPLERLWRDVRVDRIWDGTSEIQRHIISRAMLRPLGA